MPKFSFQAKAGEIEFESPANRIISQFAPKNKFGIQLLPDLTFLRQLSIQGRLRYSTSSGTDTSNVFTPAVGETIFIYLYRVQHQGASNGTFSFINMGNTRDVSILTSTLQPLQINIFDSLVGNGTDTIGLDISNAGGTSITSIFGWSENTSRIRDPVI